jgi:hypothetical protein
MSRPKGSLNKKTKSSPPTLEMSIETRIEFLANIIIERILEDQKNGGALARQLEAEGYV